MIELNVKDFFLFHVSVYLIWRAQTINRKQQYSPQETKASHIKYTNYEISKYIYTVDLMKSNLININICMFNALVIFQYKLFSKSDSSTKQIVSIQLFSKINNSAQHMFYENFLNYFSNTVLLEQQCFAWGLFQYQLNLKITDLSVVYYFVLPVGITFYLFCFVNLLSPTPRTI